MHLEARRIATWITSALRAVSAWAIVPTVGIPLRFPAHREPTGDARHSSHRTDDELAAGRRARSPAPSRLGLVATITSRTVPPLHPSNERKESTVSSSGPTPSIEGRGGRPARDRARGTPPLRSIAPMSEALLDYADERRGRGADRGKTTQSPSSVRLKHSVHGRTRSPSDSSACASRWIWFSARRSKR